MEQLSLLEDSRREDPSSDDRSHVIRIADRVLAELEAEPPIDLGMVASFQGIASVRRCALPNGGCLVTDADSGAVEIRLRSSDHPRRQRFTGFHEVTHTFLPGYRLQVRWRCDPTPAAPAKEEVEVLCDIGAGELILPRRMVTADLAGADFGLPVIFTIADTYHASVQATAHRFVDLWPEDTLLVVAEIAHKPADARDPEAVPRLRVQYSSGSGRWPFIPRHKSFADSDPVVRALTGELVDERTALRGLSTETVEGVDLSARICPYFDSQGEKHDRVLALYRRPAYHR
jgi:IrrE N-terminal-like domain